MLEFYAENSTTIVIICVVIFTAIVLGRAFLGSWLANEKGRSSGTWFWLCLFFGIPALIALGFSQDIDIRKIAHKIERANNPDMSVTWKCPKCGIENPNNLYTCSGCGYKLA
ncbi:MAG: hypothetical protein FWB73_03110 [Treponema sp.]|nr:hypothetical protein [Treponema sp.]